MNEPTAYKVELQRDGVWRDGGVSTGMHGLPAVGDEFTTGDGWFARVVEVAADDQPPVVRAVEFRAES